MIAYFFNIKNNLTVLAAFGFAKKLLNFNPAAEKKQIFAYAITAYAEKS